MKKHRLANSFTSLGQRLLRALTVHPVELIVLMHATAACIIQESHLWLQPAYYAAFAAVAALCLSQCSKRRPAVGWAYWAVLPLYAACAFLPTAWHSTTSFYIMIAILPAVYLLASGRTDKEGFGARFLSLVRSLVVALCVGGLLLVLAMLIYYSTEALFNFKPGKAEIIISAVCTMFITPLLFIGMEDSAGEPTAKRLEAEIVNYVLTPALLIYTLMLYVYMVWIAVRWQLPEGSVSTMISVFGAVAMGVSWLRIRMNKRLFEWYFRLFGLIALPLVALLWVAAGYRVAQYGLTVDRCLLLGIGAVLTVYTLLSLFRLRRLAYSITALVVLLGVVLAVGGPLSARQISVRSQLGIVRNHADKIGILNADGTLTKPSHQDGDSIYRKEHRTIYQAMKYIQSDLKDTTLCREKLGLTTGDYLEGLSRSTYNYATAWRPEYTEYDEVEAVMPTFYLNNDNFGKNVDISEYSQMVADVCVAKGRVPVPGGSLSTDSVLVTQLALIGYTPQSNLERETLKDNEEKLLTYHSPDDSLIVVFSSMTLEAGKNGYYISHANVRYALKK